MALANGSETKNLPMDNCICGSGNYEGINGPHIGKPRNQIKEGNFPRKDHKIHEPKAGSHMRNTKYSATSHMKG